MSVDKLVEDIVTNFCAVYPSHMDCKDDTSFERCKDCYLTLNVGSLSEFIIAKGYTKMPFRVGSIVYCLDVADVHRPIKEKIVAEISYEEKRTVIVLRDPITQLRSAFDLTCSDRFIFPTYEEAETHLIRTEKLRRGDE